MKLLLALIAVVAFVSGCGGGNATVTPKIVSAAATARLSSDLWLTPFQRWVEPRAESPRAVAQVSQTTATSITSLQYYIQSIQLCEDITLNGTGYSGTSGCSNLYVNSAAQDTNYYNTYTITDAVADTDTTHYIDFLNATSRATLEQAATVDARTYRYALINFMRPIKMTAEFKDSGGTTRHYTKSGGSIVSAGTESGREKEVLRLTNSTTGPAELMTYMLDNGGTWFPFLEPFTVNDGDSVFVDFVFNPANFATASETTAGCGTPATTVGVFDTTNCVTFDLPYAKMAPVPRKTGETTRKEVYLITDYVNGGASDSDVRIELYYNSADSAKAIRGVDTALVMGATATAASGNVIQAYKVTETSNVVTFIGYNQNTSAIDAETLTGLTRRVDGTLTIKCQFSGGPCATADGSSITKTYTYVGDSAIN